MGKGGAQARVMAACCGTPVEKRGPIDHLLHREASVSSPAVPTERQGWKQKKKKTEKKDTERGRKAQTN